MAARIEKQRSETRKARLIKQNEMHRRDLRAELQNLRNAAGWMEAGFAFYRTAGRIKNWTAPPPHGKKRSTLGQVFRGCMMGFRLWKNL